MPIRSNVQESELGGGSASFYANSHATDIDWSNGLYQRLTSKTDFYVPSFSNWESDQEHTFIVLAGADECFVMVPLDSAHYARQKAFQVEPNNYRIVRIVNTDSKYFWHVEDNMPLAASTVWDTITGLTDDGLVLTKTAVDGWSNAGACDDSAFYPVADFHFRAEVSDAANSNFIIGFVSSIKTTWHYNDFAYGLQHNGVADYRRRVGAAYSILTGTPANGDIMEVKYDVVQNKMLAFVNATQVYDFGAMGAGPWYPYYVSYNQDTANEYEVSPPQ